MTAELKEALQNFQQAWYNVLENCPADQEFNDKYPFHKCFLELFYDVTEWVDSEITAMK